MADTHLEAACPGCGKDTLELATFTHEIPYFGEVMNTVVKCGSCGYRHVDFMPLTQRDPARHTVRVRTADDLKARVVRAASGTYRIPELGFVAEPAPASEAFVTNVEGIFERARDVFIRARVLSDDVQEKRLLDERLARLQAILDGKEQATVVLEDPYGHSAILGDRVEVQPLTEAEAKRLASGYVILDREDLR